MGINKLLKHSISIVFISLVSSCSPPKEVLSIAHDHPQLSYAGRIDTTAISSRKLLWSGSSITLNFEGESINGIFQDSQGDSYFNVIVDGRLKDIVRPATTKTSIELANNLGPGAHRIEVFKRTEWTKGSTAFFGFEISGDAKALKKPEAKKRRIEFFGDSITAGYAVEDTTGNDSPEGMNTNNYLSYATITARHFDADYRCICQSGIGIMISWFPATMPDIYDKLDPSKEKSNWSFALYQPEIVVVNLMQNDSWLVHRPEREEFVNKFGVNAPDSTFIINAYQQFVADLRNHYPDATMICMLGNMDITKEGSLWPNYVKQAVENLEDKKIHHLFTDYKDSPGHPSIAEQARIANELIAFIEKNVAW